MVRAEMEVSFGGGRLGAGAGGPLKGQCFFLGPAVMTDEVYTFLPLFKSHLFDSVLAERRPHMLFLCVRTVCLCNTNLGKMDGAAVTPAAQVLRWSVGQKYGNAFGVPLSPNSSMDKNRTKVW